jgi:nitrogen regulatory protein P-II 1
MGQNDVMNLSESLKEFKVGGITVNKVKGRGKISAPEIHTFKGSEVFVPQFSEKYLLEVIIPDSKEEGIIKVIKENARGGKIFVSEVLRAIDISTDTEGEETI